MSCYENLVMKTQMNYSRHYSTYASGGTAVVLSKQKPLPYEEQIQEFVRRVQEAECIIVGGASGLSAAGGGDFYYSDTPSFREHFGKFASSLRDLTGKLQPQISRKVLCNQTRHQGLIFFCPYAMIDTADMQ